MKVKNLEKNRLIFLNDSRSGSVNRFRNIKKTCDKCNKTYKESKDPLTIHKTSKIDENGASDRIEEEFFPYCPKCFKKEIKRYKKAQWISTMLGAKFIDEKVLLKHRDGLLSEQELDELWRKYLKCQ